MLGREAITATPEATQHSGPPDPHADHTRADVPDREPGSAPDAAGPNETTVAGGDRAQAPSTNGSVLPEPAQDVVDEEGPAARGAAGQHGQTTVWLFARGEKPRRVGLDAAPGLAANDANFVWADLSGFTELDLRRAADLLELPPSGVAATLARWQPPRLDVDGRVYVVLVTVPRLDATAYRVQADQLALFVDRNFLVSAHKQPLPLANRALARARQNPELMREDSSFLLYVILDELLAYYENLDEQVEDEIERMEERALADTSDAYLEDLLRLKRCVFALSRLAGQHRAVFAAFLRPDFPFDVPDTMKTYFQDVAGRHGRLLDALTADKEAVNGAFDIYVSHMSHRTNRVMKTLTIVSTLLLPASVILAFFGTNNIESLPALTQPIGFVLMMISILAVCGAILGTFWRKGWL